MLVIFKTIFLKTVDFNIFLHRNRVSILFFVEVILKLLINLFFLFLYTIDFFSYQFFLFYEIKDLDCFKFNNTVSIVDLCFQMDSSHSKAEGRAAALTQSTPAAVVEGVVPPLPPAVVEAVVPPLPPAVVEAVVEPQEGSDARTAPSRLNVINCGKRAWDFPEARSGESTGMSSGEKPLD